LPQNLDTQKEKEKYFEEKYGLKLWIFFRHKYYNRYNNTKRKFFWTIIANVKTMWSKDTQSIYRRPHKSCEDGFQIEKDRILPILFLF
jgi:hypothetical protein